MRGLILVLFTSACSLSPSATSSTVSDVDAFDPVLVNETDSLFSDSVGVSFLALYPGCPDLRVQADLWKLVDGQPVFQNRCVTGADGWGLCPHREVQTIGASAGAFFFNVWRATSDCGGYASVVRHDVHGTVRASDTYNAFTAGRVVAAQKRSYELRLDAATGAIYELYSRRFPGHRINAIHANMGAALQFAFHDSIPIMTNACGDGSSGVNYWNPTQGGAYCLFHNGIGQPTITQPSATTTRSDSANATTLATSEHNLMNWSYGTGYEGPWNLGDVARLRQTVTAYEDYFVVDWTFTNIGATRNGFAELPAFYFTNGFRESWIQPTASSLVNTVLPLVAAPSLGDTQPASSLGAGPLLNGRFYSDHQANWAMFRNVDDPTQLYTLAWFYSPELRADRTDPPSFQIGQTSFNMKFGTYYSFTARSNAAYRIRYAVFPFAMGDQIEFRGGIHTVAHVIEVLRNEFEGAPAPVDPPQPPAPAGVAPLDGAASNDVLWAPGLAVDGVTTSAYSSAWFSSATNDRGSYLHAWSSAGPQTVSRVLLRARLVEDRPAGFPSRYRVYVANANNDGWDVVADNLDWTPNADGLVVVPFSPRHTTGVLLVPLELGVDSAGQHYFQLAELSWAP